MKKTKKILILTIILGLMGSNLAFGNLKRAVRTYKGSNYEKSAALFYDLSKKKVSPDLSDKFNIFLANSLFKIGMYQSSVAPLLNIVKRQAASSYLISAIRKLIVLFHLLHDPKILESFSTLPSSEYPYLYSDTLHYLVGRHYYSIGNYKKALEHLSKVPDNSPHFYKSKYIVAIIHYFNNNPKDAVQELRDLLEVYGFGEDLNLEDETYVALGRIFYSLGRFKKAIELYSAVPKNSSKWPVAMYESIWALFLSGNYNKALGQLLALTSPYFSHVVIHEMYIIESIIYYDLCQYELANLAIKGFHAKYDNLIKELEESVGTYKSSPIELANLLKSTHYGFSYMLKNFLDADPDIQEKKFQLKRIEEEVDLLNNSGLELTNSRLGKFISRRLKQKHTKAVGNLGATGLQSLEKLSGELNSFASQADVVQFESLNIEKRDLERRQIIDAEFEDMVSAELKKYGKVKGTKLFPAKEYYYWPFDEFWVDELDSYVFSLERECK